MLEPNKVIIFPSKKLETWDSIPRFNFLLANLQDRDNTKEVALQAPKKIKRFMKDKEVGD